MKLQNLLSAAALASLMSLPLNGLAQERNRDDNLKRQSSKSTSSRNRDDDRRESGRRDNDRRDDRSNNDRRGNDRRGNDRWDQNNGHDNGRHNGWDKRDDNRRNDRDWDRRDDWDRRNDRDRWDDDRNRRTTVIVNYNTRHDDWHRSHHTSHRDSCSYDGGNWRTYDTRYYRNDYGRYDDRYYSPSYEYQRREETSREWRNLATLGGLLSVIGVLNNDDTLVFAGAAGALYSEYRYQQDRRSQDRIARARAYYFDQPYFYRDGCRYERRNVSRNGQRYFQFVRCD